MKKYLVIAAAVSSIAILSGCSQPENSEDDRMQGQLQTQPQSLSDQKADIQPLPREKSNTNNANNSKDNVMELEIKTNQPGTGDREVKAGDTVSVQYAGRLTDGTKFDSTADHGGTPFTFTVGAGQVIKGWDQGLLGAKVGEKRTLTIPSDMGYGAAGAGGVIPPNATLIFDIEVESIK